MLVRRGSFRAGSFTAKVRGTRSAPLHPQACRHSLPVVRVPTGGAPAWTHGRRPQPMVDVRVIWCCAFRGFGQKYGNLCPSSQCYTEQCHCLACSPPAPDRPDGALQNPGLLPSERGALCLAELPARNRVCPRQEDTLLLAAKSPQTREVKDFVLPSRSVLVSYGVRRGVVCSVIVCPAWKKSCASNSLVPSFDGVVPTVGPPLRDSPQCGVGSCFCRLSGVSHGPPFCPQFGPYSVVRFMVPSWGPL